MNTDFTTIDEYIAMQSEKNALILEKIRQMIKTIAPKAEETISYGIPTFKLYGNLIHFAAYKNHIGFYPGTSGIAEFLKEISKYKNSKGAVQFPLKEDLPIDLIKKIVASRVNENISKNDN
jgi:uncharacterized protein YdhG (YjbR/CyaY superfamily)